MLKVKIANEELYCKEDEGVWYDLMTETGVKSAYKYSNEIMSSGSNYIIVDIRSDWARCDDFSVLDDMVEISNIIRSMIDGEVKLFKKIYKENIHEPYDIASKIRFNEMKYKEDVTADDEIWETVFFEEEEKTIAIIS